MSDTRVSSLVCICLGLLVILLRAGAYADDGGDDEYSRISHSAELIVNAGKARLMPSTLFGVFFEEINHAGDGGLWADLVYNRGFEAGGRHSPSWIDPWGMIGNDTQIMISTDLSSKFENNKVALRMDILCDSCSDGVGIYNPGYSGMNLQKGKTYNIVFYVRSTNNLKLTVSFTNDDGSRVIASKNVTTGEEEEDEWMKKELELIPRSTETNGRIQITATKKGTIWLDQVSAMPADTHKGHGFRPDLFQMVHNLKPGFFRFPGGCFVEGSNLRNAYRWKETVGPWENRPGHFNDVWGYWTDDGLGYLEYLQLAEDLGAEPVWVINNGISHNDNVNTTLIKPFVQEMLDSLEFANGKPHTKWGSVRAKMGRVKPFNIKYVAIGNEDCNKPNYKSNYLKFYSALKKSYPHIKAISNCDGSPGMPLDHPADFYDYHIYADPTNTFAHASYFDHKPRNGPKAFVSEYAVTYPGNENDEGTVRGALAEAAFLLGIERNSDAVAMASYAPLFNNIKSSGWKPDAIFFNSFEYYAIPSYWMQTFFKESNGANHLHSKFKTNTPNNLVASAISYHNTQDHKNYIRIKFVNMFDGYVDVNITLAGIHPKALKGSTKTVLTGDPGDVNSMDDPHKIVPKTKPFHQNGKKLTTQLSPHSLTSIDVINESHVALPRLSTQNSP